MTCPDCLIASENALTGRFSVGCEDCKARMLAGEPAFFETAAAEAITPGYRARLQQVFGSGWKDGHAAVKRWAERIAEAKQQETKP